MNQEREEYAAKLRKQFNDEKERDMIEYLRNQEEQRKKYEERYFSLNIFLLIF